ncbi:signal recognition particle-docking protein FtsY [Govanella unica]|uniref:Signal recognition particle receptor FtsY n=1 Tax=Govanella unica TaxID=2975056 RepID=A0A9X3TVZ6_9PROT|nr:signal recognition particle-docking protein FtsY [Govania unica]MDA5192719.1 signal recognition particle-docking protein FtsY [Govania unica]
MTDSTPEKRSWLQRLKAGLSRSKTVISEGLTGIFTKRKLDDAMLEELEDLLITADLGVAMASRVTAHLAKTRYDKDISPGEVQDVLAREVTAILEPLARPLVIDSANRPHVILMVGVNGSGKTTTIGKLARQFKDQGKRVMLAAGDTFRAAAIEQLQIWGTRTGVPVIASKVGGDAAGLAYEALEAAQKDQIDVLLIDTAGRLQNKSGLMDELAKLVRVIRKLDPTAPHDVILVLDATTGQNALNQTQVFRDVADVSGIVMTKLDGTAKGGVLVALGEKFGLPIHAIGVGESVEDLHPFAPETFARALVGIEDM